MALFAKERNISNALEIITANRILLVHQTMLNEVKKTFAARFLNRTKRKNTTVTSSMKTLSKTQRKPKRLISKIFKTHLALVPFRLQRHLSGDSTRQRSPSTSQFASGGPRCLAAKLDEPSLQLAFRCRQAAVVVCTWCALGQYRATGIYWNENKKRISIRSTVKPTLNLIRNSSKMSTHPTHNFFTILRKCF